LAVRIASELGNMRVSEQMMPGNNGDQYKSLFNNAKNSCRALTIPIIGNHIDGVGHMGWKDSRCCIRYIIAATFDRGLVKDFIPYNVTFALIKSYTFAFIIVVSHLIMAIM
jgi:phospholipid/cholesterol/gamma-HCH transport system permease protein